MAEITEDQVAAGVRSYRARCLDHGIEWRTTMPESCQQCEADFAAATEADKAADKAASKAAADPKSKK